MANHARLVGKLAVVTGGGSGIGRAICHRLAAEGASVAVVDINQKHCDETTEALSSIHDNKHVGYTVDVAQSTQVKDLIHKINDDMIMRSNILVNCAGIIRDNFLLKISEEDFDEVIKVNLKATYLMTRAFIGNLNISGKFQPGNIVNISSIIGKSGNVGQSNYAAAKAGVIGFTKSTAYEYGRFGIRANAILPGFIKTPMTDGVPEKELLKVEKQIPMKRFGTPEEIANACLFLVSDESSYVNAACLEVTGGLLA